MELVKLQHKLSELLWEAQGNLVFATSKYVLQCFLEFFCPMRKTNKNINIDLCSHFLSSPLSLSVSVPDCSSPGGPVTVDLVQSAKQENYLV